MEKLRTKEYPRASGEYETNLIVSDLQFYSIIFIGWFATVGFAGFFRINELSRELKRKNGEPLEKYGEGDKYFIVALLPLLLILLNLIIATLTS